MPETSIYLLDANIFIEAKKRYYPLDVATGYWNAIVWHHNQGNLQSIDKVGHEIEVGGDELSEWVVANLPEAFFVSTDDPDVIRAFGTIIAWAQASAHFTDAAKAEFAASTDAWLIAFAVAKHCSVVSLEEYDPNIRKKIKIPNVCQQFGVPCISLVDMIRALGIVLTWTSP